MMRAALSVAVLCLLSAAGHAQDAACAAAPEPVFTLSYGSRYAPDSASRSDLDAGADRAVDAALGPVDDFLRALTRAANEAAKDSAKDSGSAAPDTAALADCVVAQVAIWALADALADLQSPNARMTIGARIAGFALVLRQVAPLSTRADDVAAITAWLVRMMQAQMLYWEEEAPPGARQGNLRAWAAMAGAATAALADDTVMRGWAGWSLIYVMCKAAPDGSLPQEMSRKKFALKYQLHAIAPLVVGSLILDRDGVPLLATCDHALRRIVAFAVADLDTGAATQAITGEVQSLFDGTDAVEPFILAWLEAYLILDRAAATGPLKALADAHRPLSYSKLGGNQSVLWANDAP